MGETNTVVITKSPLELWCDALESGKYYQGEACLFDGDRYCCLGVACEVYRLTTGKGEWLEGPIEEKGCEPHRSFYPGEGSPEDNFLPKPVQHWLGIAESDPNVLDPSNGREKSLSVINDEGESNFKSIAAIIRTQLVPKSN